MKILIVFSLCAVAVFAMPMNHQCPAGMETVCDAVKTCMQTVKNGQPMPAQSNPRTRPTAEQKAAFEACIAQRGITQEQLSQLKASVQVNGSRQGGVTQG